METQQKLIETVQVTSLLLAQPINRHSKLWNTSEDQLIDINSFLVDVHYEIVCGFGIICKHCSSQIPIVKKLKLKRCHKISIRIIGFFEKLNR